MATAARTLNSAGNAGSPWTARPNSEG
jgi:hypothetical protein